MAAKVLGRMRSAKGSWDSWGNSDELDINDSLTTTPLLSLVEVTDADWQTNPAEGTLGHEFINPGYWSTDCAVSKSPEQHICPPNDE
jgi:hypothetical protein